MTDDGLPEMPKDLIEEIETIYEMRRIADHLPSTIQKLEKLGGSVYGSLRWEVSQDGGKNLYCWKSGDNYGLGRQNTKSDKKQIGYFSGMAVEAIEFVFAGYSLDVNRPAIPGQYTAI